MMHDAFKPAEKGEPGNAASSNQRKYDDRDSGGEIIKKRKGNGFGENENLGPVGDLDKPRWGKKNQGEKGKTRIWARWAISIDQGGKKPVGKDQGEKTERNQKERSAREGSCACTPDLVSRRSEPS